MNTKIRHSTWGFNRKNILAFFMMLFFSLSARADLNTDLIAHWNFDDCTAQDSSPNALNGNIIGNPSCVNGITGKALEFNGNDVIERLYANIPAGNFSVSLWVKANDMNSGIFSVNSGSVNMNDGHDRHIYLSSGQFCQRVWSAGDGYKGSSDTNHDGYRQYVSCTTASLSPRFNHIVYTVTSTDILHYVNGVLVKRISGKPSEFSWRDRFLLGVSFDARSHYFKGVLDEFRYYNRALSTHEVAELYATSLPIPSLRATAVSPNAIQLSWNKDTRGAQGFRLQRKAGDCNSANSWATLVDTNTNTSFVQDTSLNANTDYSYQMANYYGGQSFSTYADCTSATTGIAGTPRAPISVTAVAESSTAIMLSWGDVSTNEASFNIYRKVDTGSWALLQTTAANVQSYRDSSALSNSTTTLYSYDVRACNALGCSRANPIPLVVPFSPTNLTATVGTTIKLAWNQQSSQENGFQIRRKNGNCASTTPWTTIALPIIANNISAYDDNSAISNSPYAYQVRAYQVRERGIPNPYYSVGYSEFSNCISKTAP